MTTLLCCYRDAPASKYYLDLLVWGKTNKNYIYLASICTNNGSMMFFLKFKSLSPVQAS